MPKIEGIIKSEIVRLSRRELRQVFIPLRREVRQMRARLASLSGGLASLNRAARELRLGEVEPKMEATPEEVKASRITPARIMGLRRKLGISQREMGILTGASLGAVRMREKGKFKPKPGKKAALVVLRKLKKREVRKLLAEKAEAPKGPKKKPSKALPRKMAARRKKAGGSLRKIVKRRRK